MNIGLTSTGIDGIYFKNTYNTRGIICNFNKLVIDYNKVNIFKGSSGHFSLDTLLNDTCDLIFLQNFKYDDNLLVSLYRVNLSNYFGVQYYIISYGDTIAFLQERIDCDNSNIFKVENELFYDIISLVNNITTNVGLKLKILTDLLYNMFHSNFILTLEDYGRILTVRIHAKDYVLQLDKDITKCSVYELVNCTYNNLFKLCSLHSTGNLLNLGTTISVHRVRNNNIYRGHILLLSRETNNIYLLRDGVSLLDTGIVASKSDLKHTFNINCKGELINSKGDILGLLSGISIVYRNISLPKGCNLLVGNKVFNISSLGDEKFSIVNIDTGIKSIIKTTDLFTFSEKILAKTFLNLRDNLCVDKITFAYIVLSILGYLDENIFEILKNI